MRQWRFEVSNRSGFDDAHGEGILDDIRELGIRTVEGLHFTKVYLIEDDFDRDFAERVAQELLCDMVCQEYYIGRSAAPAGPMKATLIEVHLKSGVTDPVAQSVVAALKDMGTVPANVRTARKYILLGQINDSQRDEIARRVLSNDCIEEVVYGTEQEPPSPHTNPIQSLRISFSSSILSGQSASRHQ